MHQVAIVGDSHMALLGPPLRAAVQELGATVLRIETQAGWSTGQYVSSGKIATATQGADFVILELGGNDLQGDDSKAAYATLLANARRMIPAKQIFWVGPSIALPGANADAMQRHELAARYQRALVPKLSGCAWFDSRPYTESGHRADDVHFTPDGYARWADGIIEGLSYLATPQAIRAISMSGTYGLFSLFRGV